MTITVFNPSVATSNTGDFIIADAVMAELGGMFPGHQIASIPTQDRIGKPSIALANLSDYRFVGGTNLLSAQMLHYRQWKIGLREAKALSGVLLMGVGWWQYQRDPDLYTSLLLRKVLCKSMLHSVRDEYTKRKLESIGVRNVINTGCPTMWGLSPEHCARVPSTKAQEVVFTLTDYNRAPVHDSALIRTLKDAYRRVHYWPQGNDDPAYLHSLGVDGIAVLAPSLGAYNSILDSHDSLDYVGTRLHGGVRALQKFRRALILAVDNRAMEISRDTNLPVVDRSDIPAIEAWIRGQAATRLMLNADGIKAWRNQFREQG